MRFAAGAGVKFRYQPRQNNAHLRERLIELAREKPRFGYRRLYVLLRREGERVNHKRVHRIYREAGLSIRRKKRADEFSAAGVHGGEPGMGLGFRS